MKSYKIKMLPLAKIDLSEMIDYLSDFSETAALSLYDRIIKKINGLKQFPLACEECSAAGLSIKYRRLVIDNYLIFYVVLEDYVEIHRIVHAKRDISKIF